MSDYTPHSRPPLVLIASDQEWSTRSLESILGPHGYAVLRAFTGEQTLELARSADVSAVVLDMRLPDMSGVELCRRLRDGSMVPASTPVILTSVGAVSYAERLEVFGAGAWALLTQPFDGTQLLLQLDTFLRARREVELLRESSLLDQSTGLYNAKGLARRAREMGAEALRRRTPIACVAFVLEPAEERLGNDDVTELSAWLAKHLAALVRRAGRESDVVGRLGQMEFAVIAPTTEAQGAIRLAERLQESIDANPPSLRGRRWRVRVRAGYAAVPDLAESSLDAVELLLRASAALRYVRAKDEANHILAFSDVPVMLPH